MNNKLVMSTIGIAIGLIVVGSVLAPVIWDAQHANDTVYHNTNPYGIGSIYEFDEDTEETIVITICNGTNRTVSINGEVLTVAAYQPVFLSDACAIRFYANNMNFTSSEGSRTITEATITINQGMASFTVLNNTTPIDISPKPLTWAFIHDADGDYIATSNDSAAGFDLYSEKGGIYAANWVTATQEYFSIRGEVVTISNANGAHTASVDWKGEYLDNGVYKMHLNNTTTSDYTFVTDNAGEPYTVSPFLVCVPSTVIGTPDEDSGVNSLYSAILIMTIIALLVSAVTVVRNKD